MNTVRLASRHVAEAQERVNRSQGLPMNDPGAQLEALQAMVHALIAIHYDLMTLLATQ